MTTKTLFIILIRTVTLYFLVQAIVSTIPQFLIAVMSDYDPSEARMQLAYAGAQLILFLIVCYLLISKAPWIVQLFRFTKGTDEEKVILDKVQPLQIAHLGVYLIGIILIVLNLSDFVIEIWAAFKNEVSDSFSNPWLIQNMWAYGLNIFLGVLIIGSSNQIAKRMAQKSKLLEEDSPLDTV